MSKLNALWARRGLAIQRFRDELIREFPEGSEVFCILSNRQLNPSRGTVVYLYGDGTVRIRLEGGTCKNVHFEQVHK